MRLPPIYLTIDDAPSETFLDKLALLDQHGIRAIWFCQGNYMEQRPQSVVKAIRRGHVIANHSYSHPSFEQIPLDHGFAEIRATDAIIDELYAQAGTPRIHRFFRFPYGNKGDGDHDPAKQDKRQALQDYLRRLGYTHLTASDPAQDVDWLWTFSTNDWSPFYPAGALPDFTTPAQVLDAAARWNPSPGDAPKIILVHDTPGAVAHQLFCDLIRLFVAKGLAFAR